MNSKINFNIIEKFKNNNEDKISKNITAIINKLISNEYSKIINFEVNQFDI